MLPQPTRRRSTGATARCSSNQAGFKSCRSHPFGLAFQQDESKGEVLPQDLCNLPLDSVLFTDVAQICVLLPVLLLREVDVPDSDVGAAAPIQQRAPDVLTENASVVWRRPRCIEVHLRLVEKKVLGDAVPEIALSVRSDPHDPLLLTAMPPSLALLIEEVDAILGNAIGIEWVPDGRKPLKKAMKPSAEVGRRVRRCPRGE